MKKAVLLDLGNTLIHFFEISEFPQILKRCIAEVYNFLHHKNLVNLSYKEIWKRVNQENYENSDYSVRPLENRLIKIFNLKSSIRSSNLIIDICRCFMKPIFDQSHCYKDTLPALREIKIKGFKTAIVSNTTWGSPSNLWRKELKRFGLDPYIDVTVFCRDVGWRKPARQIFEYTLEKLKTKPEECIFVGDDPRWDILGPKAVGITPILIDRNGIQRHDEKTRYIKNLIELLNKLYSF